MEATYCPRCGQKLLADEADCWQCGYRLQGVEESEARAPEQEQKVAGQSAASPLVIYGFLTVCVIAAALLVTAALGRQPRVQAARVALPEGWSVVADGGRTFTVYLPGTWAFLDASNVRQRETIEQLMAGPAEYRAATKPLMGYVEDEMVLFLAQGSNAPGSGTGAGAFFIAVRSDTLNGLTAAEAIGLAQENEELVAEAGQVTNFERTHVALRTEYQDEGTDLHCRQQFTNGRQFALLLALCSTPGRFSEQAANTILQSTQRLAP